jgi:ubiquinone/menaquinone biosynthesis C-methylase UbiE
MPESEFDQYVQSYRDIINKGAAITGETFEYFIDLRLRLLDEELRDAGRPRPRAILDFGCGIGTTAERMRSRFPDAQIDGIDASEQSIKKAEEQKVSGARFHFSQDVNLPFSSGTFDLIYSNGTFHHIDFAKHASLLAELARVLRPGGQLFVFENNPLNPLMVRGMRRNPFDEGTRMLFPWYLRSRVRRAGLSPRALRFYVFYPKQLKALRFSERYLRSVPLGGQYYVWGEKA